MICLYTLGYGIGNFISHIYDELSGAYTENQLTVNDRIYKIIKLLSKGKGGYSYLAEKGGKHYVLKQIRHEPCDYYTFGNKIEAEKNDYNRLLRSGIRISKILDIDIGNERILKEYIEGETIFELVKNDKMNNKYIEQIRYMAQQFKNTN